MAKFELIFVYVIYNLKLVYLKLDVCKNFRVLLELEKYKFFLCVYISTTNKNIFYLY